MKIFVDSDAIPKVLRELLAKAAEREAVPCFFVAARPPRVPPSPWVTAIGAGSDFDGADDWIVAHVESGHLVVTADIQLADRAITKGAEVLNLRGEFFTPDNIKNALAMRLLMEELRTVGEISGGPAPFSDRARIRFADSLTRFLQKS